MAVTTETQLLRPVDFSYSKRTVAFHRKHGCVMAFLSPERLQRLADELAFEMDRIVWADRIRTQPEGDDHAPQDEDQESPRKSGTKG